MELLEAFNKRYSARNYDNRKVEEDKIERVLNVVNLVPTAKNLQPFKIYHLKSDEALGKIRSITKSAYNAPHVLLVAVNKDEEWVNPYSNVRYGLADASILVTYLMLKLVEEGLDSVYVGWFNEEKVKEAFNLPTNYSVAALLPFGYSKDEPSPMHFKKKELSTLIEEC